MYEKTGNEKVEDFNNLIMLLKILKQLLKWKC